MKKILALLLVIIMSLSLVACGGKKEVKLTMDNVKDYLEVTSQCECDVDNDEGSVKGIYYNNYTGEATLKIKISNKTEAKYENTKVTLYISNVRFTGGSNGVICGWEFSNDNIHEGSGMSGKNYKTLEVEVPADGNTEVTERLELKLYSQWSDLVGRTPDKLSNSDINVGIDNVSGTAIG
ncbi:MAG: hypothetical protein U0L27_08035 [Ruminococcus sp.]|nr:hypothetical protein [Ruminococcus sp.]